MSAWPEWLTPEYNAIHAAIENEIKRALQHCYDSADASGLDWTTEGWISCSASNVIGMLKRVGSTPPTVGDVECDEDDGMIESWPMPEDPVCAACKGYGQIEGPTDE